MFRTSQSFLQVALHPQAVARYAEGAAGDESMEPALRAELFSAEQMEQHGIALAKQHTLSARSSSDRLLKRLDENAGLLLQTCEALTTAAKGNRRISPAAEWLLDNYYLIEDQIRIARRHLPKRYNRELPCLAQEGEGAGNHLARRRPRGRRKPESLHFRLPDRAAADPRRAVGDPDHAAPGVDR
jgi:hypothetical protein